MNLRLLLLSVGLPMVISATVCANGESLLKPPLARVGGTTEPFFGSSLARSGETLVVGAYFEDGIRGERSSGQDNLLPQSGSAYVYTRQNGRWGRQARLAPANLAPTMYFGQAVAIDGDTIVVGAPYESSSSTGVNSSPDDRAFQAGAAYVFVRNGATWTQQAYLKASDSKARSFFGYSVGISGDTIVVGAHGEMLAPIGSDPGSAYVFVRSGTTWTQEAILRAANPGVRDAFGLSVDIDGDTVVVGAPNEDTSAGGVNPQPDEGLPESGAAYVFTRSGIEWTQRAFLKASSPASSALFGSRVSLSGNTVAVSAPEAKGAASGKGLVYLFARGGEEWTQEALLRAPTEPEPKDGFGIDVDVNGDTVAIGAQPWFGRGVVHLFERMGKDWAHALALRPLYPNNDFNARFVVAVTCAEGSVIAGFPYDSTGLAGQSSESARRGAVYVFDEALQGGFEALIEEGAVPSGKIAIWLTGSGHYSATLDSQGQPRRSTRGRVTQSPAGGLWTIPVEFPASGALPATTVIVSIHTSSGRVTGAHESRTLRGFRLLSLNGDPARRTTAAFNIDDAEDRMVLPAGYGFASGVRSRRRLVSLQGFLGDGQPMLLALNVSRTGQAIVFVQPYRDRTTSFFGGILDIETPREFGAPGYVVRPIPALQWRKKADGRSLSYVAGFGESVPVRVNGWSASWSFRNTTDMLTAGFDSRTVLFNQFVHHVDPVSMRLRWNGSWSILKSSPPEANGGGGWFDPLMARFSGEIRLAPHFRHVAVSGVFLHDTLHLIYFAPRSYGVGLVRRPLPDGKFETAGFVAF